MSRGTHVGGPGPVGTSFLAGSAVLAAVGCALLAEARPRASIVAAAAPSACRTVAEVYRAAPATSLWTASGRLTGKGRALQAFLAQRGFQGDASERQLSDALVRWSETLGETPRDMIYVEAALRPAPPCPSALLGQAAQAPDLTAFLDRMEAPNALAQALKRSVGAGRDLALARSVGSPVRAVVVDTGSARLWMLENGRVVDTMKVVVGKPGMATPQMAGRIQYATVNPYWNVPPDIVRARLAPRAAKLGAGYLPQQGYQVVDRYGLDARPLDPRSVNWSDVVGGRRKVGIRQLPGPANMMGAVKFIFPNQLGIYLHDTPGRWAFDRADRRLSSGCVRVERAADLYRWMFGSDLSATARSQAEQRVPLTQPVPVYLFGFSREGAAALPRGTDQGPSASAISATSSQRNSAASLSARRLAMRSIKAANPPGSRL